MVRGVPGRRARSRDRQLFVVVRSCFRVEFGRALPEDGSPAVVTPARERGGLGRPALSEIRETHNPDRSPPLFL